MRGLLVAATLLAAAAALAAAGVLWWSGATLSEGGAALARLELQPLAGSVGSLAAYGPDGTRIPIADSHGRLTPTGLVPSGVDVRVEVVVRRPRWLGWLVGRSRHETLTVKTPVTAIADRWPILTRGATLDVRFTSRVDHVVVSGLGKHRRLHLAARTLSLGRQNPAGTVEIAAAARSWEEPGVTLSVSWFPKTPGPAVQVTPAPGTQISALTPIRLTFAQPVGAVRPRFTKPEQGVWQLADDHTLVFHPGRLGFGFGASLQLRLPAWTAIVGSGAMSTAKTIGWTVAAGNLLRLHQLLAQAAYLPVVWNATGADVARTPAAEVDAAVDPPAGSFSWRFPNTPPQLAQQWDPAKVTQITRGAVMMFEHEHGLTVDGFAGPRGVARADRRCDRGQAAPGRVQLRLRAHEPAAVADALAQRPDVILTSPGNTGIPATPTQPGTYPVFEHIPVGEMKGTNPDGSHYDDKGIRWISYFHGGDALHSFNRASFGTPQSLGCVELPLASAAKVWPYTPIGTLVTIENPS